MDDPLNHLGKIPEMIRESFRCGFVDGALSSLQRISAGEQYDPAEAMEKAWNASSAKQMAEIFEPVAVAR